MKGRLHFLASVMLVVLIDLSLWYNGLDKYIVYTPSIIIGGLLPDMLEPAFTRKHRDFFHSRLLLEALTCMVPIIFIVSLYSKTFFYLLFINIGYMLHLLMDSWPRGLPRW